MQTNNHKLLGWVGVGLEKKMQKNKKKKKKGGRLWWDTAGKDTSFHLNICIVCVCVNSPDDDDDDDVLQISQ